MSENHFTIDLAQLEEQDGLESFWWNYIHPTFAFAKGISKKRYNAYPVDNHGILAHKKILEGERFPTTRYHAITIENDKVKTRLIDGKEVRVIMANNLKEFVQKNKKLPFACSYIKTTTEKKSEKEIIHIKYEPVPTFIKFEITIEADASLEGIESLPAEKENPFEDKSDTQETIQIVKSAPILEGIALTNADKVCIFDAEIVAIDKRKSFYQEHETVWFFMKVKGGTVAPDTKKSTEKKPFLEINVKISANAMAEFKMKPGDKVSFNGQLKMDAKLGRIVQNVRKFDVTPRPDSDTEAPNEDSPENPEDS